MQISSIDSYFYQKEANPGWIVGMLLNSRYAITVPILAVLLLIYSLETETFGFLRARTPVMVASELFLVKRPTESSLALKFLISFTQLFELAFWLRCAISAIRKSISAVQYLVYFALGFLLFIVVLAYIHTSE